MHRAVHDMPKLIVVAEDHEDNALIMVTLLVHFGYDVVHAVNGRVALEFCRARSPRLILLDVSMPELDGWEVCRALKNDDATRAITVLILTAHAMPSDRDKAFESG